MSATCQTCKHWSVAGPRGSTDEIINPTDPDTYEPMVTTFEVRICKHPRLLFCERPLESDGFAVADGSRYMANLYTAQDFGCLLHEAQA